MTLFVILLSAEAKAGTGEAAEPAAKAGGGLVPEPASKVRNQIKIPVGGISGILLKTLVGCIFRTKLKQTEVDCEFLKRCCENLTEENRRLQKEVQELRALKLSPQFYMHMTPPTTLTMCPSCERVSSSACAASPQQQQQPATRPMPAAPPAPWAPIPLRASFLGVAPPPQAQRS